MPRPLAVTPRSGELFDCPDCHEENKPTHIGRSYRSADSTKLVDLFICTCKNCDLKFYTTIDAPAVT